MVYQRSKGLIKAINDSGCYFLALLYIAQIERREVYSVSEVNNLYRLFVERCYITSECRIKEPDKILRYLLVSGRVTQIGVIENNKATFWGWVKDRKYDYCIAQHTTTSSYGTHFTVCDKNFSEFYDSMQGESYISKGVDRYILYKVM